MDKTNLEHGSQAFLNVLFEYGRYGESHVVIYKFMRVADSQYFTNSPMIGTSCIISMDGEKLKLSAALDYDKIIKLKGACFRKSSPLTASIWLDQLPRKMALQISRELELQLALLGSNEILEIPWIVH